MIVVATDAPLDHRNLRRLAERSLYGMALTGLFTARSARGHLGSVPALPVAKVLELAGIERTSMTIEGGMRRHGEAR